MYFGGFGASVQAYLLRNTLYLVSIEITTLGHALLALGSLISFNYLPFRVLIEKSDICDVPWHQIPFLSCDCAQIRVSFCPPIPQLAIVGKSSHILLLSSQDRHKNNG